MMHHFVVYYDTETKRYVFDAESTGYAFPSGETWIGDEWVCAYDDDTPPEVAKSFETAGSALAGLLEIYSDTLTTERSTA
jgi:hypothetical protein